MQSTLDAFVSVVPKWKCILCNNAFSTNSELGNHMKQHVVLKCDVCPAMFLLDEDIVSHRTMHAKKRHMIEDDIDHPQSTKRGKWVCEYCVNMQFSSKDNLRRHTLKLHSLRCSHCDLQCSTVDSRRDHEQLHTNDEYGFNNICMVDGCNVRCAKSEHIDVHIQSHHKMTLSASGRSEQQMAQFFQSRGVVFTRDWANFIRLPTFCDRNSARIDFFLSSKSREKNVVIFVDNDENQHKKYTQELQRMHGIEVALREIAETKDKPIVFVRFNPGPFRVDGIVRTIPLQVAHERLLETINNLEVSHLTVGLNLIYMFYDTTHGKLDFFKSAPQFANKVIQIIIT